jgi:hypothetical protein
MMYLPRQVEQAVRGAMKGQKPEVVRRAERQAVREVAFLFYLQFEINSRLWGEWRAMCLQLAYVASQLKGLFQEDEPRVEDLAEAREHAERAIREFLEWEVAVRKIAARYYAGTSPHFPGYAAQLAGALENAGRVVALVNDELDWRYRKRSAGTKGRQRKLPPLPVEPIDLEQLRQSTTPAGIDLARHIVVMAQAEAAEFLGETRQALRLVRARLWPTLY